MKTKSAAVTAAKDGSSTSPSNATAPSRRGHHAETVKTRAFGARNADGENAMNDAEKKDELTRVARLPLKDRLRSSIWMAHWFDQAGCDAAREIERLEGEVELLRAGVEALPSDSSVGFALVDPDGCPLPNTVAATELAAKVNALAAVWKVPVYLSHSDEEIDAMFLRSVPEGYSISPVMIERVIITGDEG